MGYLVIIAVLREDKKGSWDRGFRINCRLPILYRVNVKIYNFRGGIIKMVMSASKRLPSYMFKKFKF